MEPEKDYTVQIMTGCSAECVQVWQNISTLIRPSYGWDTFCLPAQASGQESWDISSRPL